MRRIDIRRRQIKRKNSEKGAITILVLVSMLFMVSFLITAEVIASNKVKSQKSILDRTRQIYESDKSMEEIYNMHIADSDIIPIYTEEQLLNVGSNEGMMVNGKFYTFYDDSVYVLMNDIETDQNSISKSFAGNFEGNGHIITITNEYD